MARWREVRVFISSTFRDMHAERDWLVKVVFPKLRERLAAHRIYFTDIDLRWGVTRQQAEKDEVLELCLAEIDRCRPEASDTRPYFLGLLGERYGWLPNRVNPETLQRYSWVQDYSGSSITALEIVYGVLLNPPMKGQSFFYLRDPALLDEVPAEALPLLRDEEPTARAKLAVLKERLRESGFPLMEGYTAHWAGFRLEWRLVAPLLSTAQLEGLEAFARDGTISPIEWQALPAALRSPLLEHGSLLLSGLEEFGKRVEDDLWSAISARYPEVAGTTGDITELPLTSELAAHSRFAEALLRVFVGREAPLARLAAYCDDQTTHPLLVSGEAGVGKSALLAHHYVDWAAYKPDFFVVPHFVGASAASTSLSSLLSRLTQELIEVLGLPMESPEDPTRLPEAFRTALGLVAESEKVLLIIDGLDQLDQRDLELGLPWLPEVLPPNVKLLASCTSGPLVEEARKRGAEVLWLSPLAQPEAATLLAELPSLSAKTLEEGQKALLLANTGARNPLYLQVALEELRGFGSFEQLESRLHRFAEVSDVTGLFGQVLERLELDFRAPLVEALTCLLAASRAGLSEMELASLTAQQDDRGELQVILRQLRPWLLRRGRQVDYYHRALKTAVEQRYWATDAGLGWRLSLVDWFEACPLDERKVEELPWQLDRAGQGKRLARLLAQPDILEATWARDEFELKGYWARLEASGEGDLVASLAPLLDNKKALEEGVLHAAAHLLDDFGHPEEALGLLGELEQRFEAAKSLSELQATLGHAALLHYTRGDMASAWQLLQRQQSLCEQLADEKGLIACLGDQARLLSRQGKLHEALGLLEKEEMLARKLGGPAELQSALHEQALVLLQLGQEDSALFLLGEQEELCRRLGHLDGLRMALGTRAMVLAKMGLLEEALTLHEEEEALCRRLGNKRGLVRALGNRGEVLARLGQPEEAWLLHQQQLALAREAHNARGIALALLHQASLLIGWQRFSEALPPLSEALQLALANGYVEEQTFALTGQAEIAEALGEREKAFQLASQAFQLLEAHQLRELEPALCLRLSRLLDT